MPDITMCKGEKCSIKNDCYRYTAAPNYEYQRYFSISPIIAGTCNKYMSNEKAIDNLELDPCDSDREEGEFNY
jgi:hypothetical protein